VSEWESVSEWLHKHSSRHIIIRAAGHYDEEGNWHPCEGAITFRLTTRLPDGRKVQSGVEIRDEVMIEPMAGDMIVHNAKMAIENLLSRGQSQAEPIDDE
jgi:hypothetical protein